ncbi:MAG: competence protein ComFB [Bermanella sp.]|nr:competence protein ComFB [Bermanella sp.]|tara:strand:+ start:897 stop:1169 length:273 start_codon:yes stop_codon:yes gene_type:complete
MSISDQIQNYYENKVVDAINRIALPKGFNQEQLTDLACLALNNLPNRYYRHEVDLAFYMSAQEHTEIDERVEKAVMFAIDYLEKSLKKAN